MGAWGTGCFENDDAMDWIWDLDDADDTTLLKDIFSGCIESKDYLEAPDGSIVIAAAGVVAALNGEPDEELPDGVTAYVEKIDTEPSADLKALATKAVKKVSGDSELKELWEEAGTLDEWLKAIAGLQKRLQ
ncbi:DUF4259 domain-containing protein [Luteolibacter ambystomatis]|uniref:DUF4259 domain-containing protein n=1 Tax=Luteolibacter ambystomatis TaxID=2824561 RepID=A0A975J0A1_9BACT|nr:DUF4259 domain-containing protein [Luteolibacter ambystomatis]QUE51643.1 DUF4259 domain-containing protein [Luteolibacter ambystomatis]